MSMMKLRRGLAAATLMAGLVASVIPVDVASAHGYAVTPFSNTFVRKGPGGSNCYDDWGLTATETHSNATYQGGCSYTACGGTSSRWVRVYSVLGDPGYMAWLCVSGPYVHS